MHDIRSPIHQPQHHGSVPPGTELTGPNQSPVGGSAGAHCGGGSAGFHAPHLHLHIRINLPPAMRHNCAPRHTPDRPDRAPQVSFQHSTSFRQEWITSPPPIRHPIGPPIRQQPHLIPIVGTSFPAITNAGSPSESQISQHRAIRPVPPIHMLQQYRLTHNSPNDRRPRPLSAPPPQPQGIVPTSFPQREPAACHRALNHHHIPTQPTAL